MSKGIGIGALTQRSPLVGRASELAVLIAGVERVMTRAAGFVAVSGEPGIGKTRLLEELAVRAQERGFRVLWGTGSELERDMPFGIWVDALDDHVDQLGANRLRRLLGDRVGELARVLP